MKNTLIIVFVINLLLIFSCKNDNQQSEFKDFPKSNFFKIQFYKFNDSLQIDTSNIVRSVTIKEDKDFVEKYICPNHCDGSGSVKEGTCKTCEMELIENVDKNL